MQYRFAMYFRSLSLLLILTISILMTNPSTAVEINVNLDGGTSFLIISGTFEFEDDPRLLEKYIHKYSPKFVTFNSPGGNPLSAMEFGRSIRRNKLHTVQTRKSDCASACSLAFMGGYARLAEAGSIGVHQSSFVDPSTISSENAVHATQKLTAKMIRYMVEMDVDASVLELGMDYDPSDMRYLSKREMARYRITTPPKTPTAAKHKKTAPATVPKEPTENSARSPKFTGQTRHPSNEITLRERPTKKSFAIQVFSNKEPVQIFGEQNRWYYVKISGQFGYVYSNLIKVDQFVDVGYSMKFIQIRSFPSLKELKEYSRTSKQKISGYLSASGWYAATLRGSFNDSKASLRLEHLKKSGRIPKDSFKTYGNTYIKRVCCN